MIKIVLYSENDDNIKKISGLMDKRDDFDLILGKYKNRSGDTPDPSNIDLILFDLSGFSLDDGRIKADIKKINEGKSPCYIAGSHGYVKNEALLKIFRNYEILFRTMPILPERISNFILDRNLQRFIKYLPKSITLFIVDFIVMLAKKDLSGFQYVHYYLYQQ